MEAMPTSSAKPPIIVSGPELEPAEHMQEKSGSDLRTVTTVLIGLAGGAVAVALIWVLMAAAVSCTSPRPAMPVRPSVSSIQESTAYSPAPAPTVAGGEQEYLRKLSGEWFYGQVGRDTVLAEGRKVCQAYRAGWSDRDIWEMVAADLGVSDYAGMDVKAAAAIYLGC